MYPIQPDCVDSPGVPSPSRPAQSNSKETENAETLTVKQSAPQPSAGADPPDYSKFDIVKATQYGNFMKMEYPNITRVKGYETREIF